MDPDVDGNPITDLAKQAGARSVVTDPESATDYASDGQEFSDAQTQALQRRQQDTAKALSTFQGDDNQDAAVRDIVQKALGWSNLTDSDKALVSFALNDYEHDYAGSVDRMSGLYFDDDARIKGKDVLFPDGYGSVTDHLAKDLTVQTGQVVKRIDWTSDGVTVTTDRGTLQADHVVVTLPLGVLQSGAVTFGPGLPEDRQTAIGRLGVGVLDKCYLRFPKVFWAETDWLMYLPAPDHDGPVGAVDQRRLPHRAARAARFQRRRLRPHHRELERQPDRRQRHDQPEDHLRQRRPPHRPSSRSPAGPPTRTHWARTPFSDVAGALGGPWLRTAVTVGGMIAAGAMFSALLTSSARVPFVLAQDGYFPAWVARRTARHRVPVVSLIGSSAIYALFCLSSFTSLIIADVFLANITLLLEVAALIALRVREPDLERPYHVPGGAIGLSFVTLSLTGVCAWATWQQYVENGARAVTYCLVAVGSCALLYLPLARRRRLADTAA
ncbi:amino acid permease [Streptomyces sp. CBMA123]|uniref:amino acid permease n=1 Tax=Streptomyces sp. CBMA123 TaxID=1896313 RepID=UPI001661AD04|nr:amino acid permease [Streptomyces sp. CBMA123]MBD0694973.1 hypothetical protein [Streptomyces sp. CBMA123]